MYQEFYGLAENPFSLTPDPQYLYFSRQHKEALAQLYYGVFERKGFMVLIGEVGLGKTLLLNWLLETFSENDILSAFIFNPVMTSAEMFEYISVDLGFEWNCRSKVQFLMKLHNLLIDRFSKGKTTVLIVDEAQNLSFNVLEELRLLTNLETNKEKLLQIILCGQPELADKLDHTSMRQLKQRIALRCRLKALSPEDTGAYIQNRLAIANLHNRTLFDDGAIRNIYEFSGGIPRIINNICDNALLAGYAANKLIINSSTITEVANDLQLSRSKCAIAAHPALAFNPNGEMAATSSLSAHKATKSNRWIAYLAELKHRFINQFSRKSRANLVNHLK